MLEQNKKFGFLEGGALGILTGIALSPFLALGAWKAAHPAYAFELTVVAAEWQTAFVERAVLDGWELTPAAAAQTAIVFAPDFGRRFERRLELTVRIEGAQKVARFTVAAEPQTPRFPLPFRFDPTILCRLVAIAEPDGIRVSRCLREQGID